MKWQARIAVILVGTMGLAASAAAENRGPSPITQKNTDGVELAKPADVCDSCDNNVTCGYCVARESENRNRMHAYKLDELGRGMTILQRAAFDKLRQADQDFAYSSSRSEVDQSGSSRSSYVIGAADDINNLFLADVEHGERGVFPGYTAAQFAALDKRLNDTYQTLMHTKIEGANIPLLPTGITKSGIKETERAWLKFRDAWVDYAGLRYPRVPGWAWKAMLTERRIKQLEDLRDADPPVINDE